MKKITLFFLCSLLILTFNSMAASSLDDTVGAQTMDPVISALVLVNATNNQDIMTLVDGMSININDLPSSSLSIRAEGSGTIGSVQLVLTGSLTNTKTENVAPYALFGDAAGNYTGQAFGIGSYGISATPYGQRNLGGNQGSGLELQFTIVDGVAQRPFITTWKTDNEGPSSDNQITIPTIPGETYDYTVDWGDGNSNIGVTGNITHTYATPGTYTIMITGDFPRIYFEGANPTFNDQRKLLQITQWGDTQWTSMDRAFAGCTYLDIVATDIPDLSQVTAAQLMFDSCTNLIGNESFGNWDVSGITNMNLMFSFASSFNQDLSNWNVSSCIQMSGMFRSTTFNQDISGWDMGSVVTMAYMFENSAFNQDISGWNVSSATDMNGMFGQADSFDQNLGNWNVSNVSLMSGMFEGVTLSTENYDALLKGWNNQQLQSGVTFDGGNSQYCNGASARWNLINTDGWTISDGGLNCPSITVPNIVGLPLAEALAALAEVGLMIDGATDASNDIIPSGSVSFQFTEPGTIVDSWPYINVEVSTGLPDTPLTVAGFNFVYADSDTDHYSVHSGVHIEVETYSPRSLTLRAIATQDVASVQLELSGPINHTIIQNSAPFALFGHESGDFDGRIFPPGMYSITATPYSGENLSGTSGSPLTRTFVVDEINTQRPFITTWKTDNTGTSSDNQITIPTFPGETYNYAVDWGDGNTDSDVTGNITHSYTTPGTYTVSITGDFPRIYFSNQGDAPKLLSVGQWGDIAWTSMESAFYGCSAMDVTALDAPDFSNALSARFMFYSCSSLVGNPVFDQWNVSNITTTQSMFGRAILFNQPIGTWDTSSVTNLNGMFSGAESFNQPIENWSTSNVSTMQAIFANANAFNQPLNAWDISNVLVLGQAFVGATSFNQPLDNWNLSNVYDLSDVFAGATSFNQDIGGWNVSNVISMVGAFERATSFNQDISNWDVSNVTTLLGIFSEAAVFDQNLGNWNVSQVTDMIGAFSLSGLSDENYDNILIGWNQLPTLQPGVRLDAPQNNYCLGADARQNLINTYGWTINDAGLDPVNCQNPILSITNFVLVDALTDTDLLTFVDGDNIDLSSLPTTSFNVRANTAGNVSSVRLELAGTLVSSRIEGKAPYALFGDSNGNYVGRQMPAGPYILSATPYSEPGASGDAGNTATINFTFNTGSAGKDNNALTTATYDIEMFPNAASEAVTISVSDPSVSVQHFVIYDASGRQVGKFNASEVSSGTEFRLPVNQFQAGIYFVLTIDKAGRVSQKQLVVK